MTINGVDGVNFGMQAGSLMGGSDDAVSKNLRRQIAEAQKQLQELSGKTEMSPEEKSKKRQEIQKEISELNNQLRQHQLEVKQKERQKQESFDDMLGGGKKAGKGNAAQQGSGLSVGSMEAMISADTSMKTAKVQGSTAAKMEGKADVLKMEIKLDSGRGGAAEGKQAELADVEKRVENATSLQLNTLAEANQKMEEAGKADQSTEKKADKEEDDERSTKETNIAGMEEVSNVGRKGEEEASQSGFYYTPVDVRL